jgi:hypothetical protein
MPNISVVQAEGAFSPVTISTRAELEALLANPPEADFGPVTIVLKTKAELANLLGALIAYGTGNTYAENGLKRVGLGDFYSGNVRGASRAIALEVAGASGVVPMPEFSAYLASVRFNGAKKSQAGAAVRGTSEDLAPGRFPTHFEPEIDVPADSSIPTVEVEETVGTSQVW